MKLPIAKLASSGSSGPTNAKQRAILACRPVSGGGGAEELRGALAVRVARGRILGRGDPGVLLEEALDLGRLGAVDRPGAGEQQLPRAARRANARTRRVPSTAVRNEAARGRAERSRSPCAARARSRTGGDRTTARRRPAADRRMPGDVWRGIGEPVGIAREDDRLGTEAQLVVRPEEALQHPAPEEPRTARYEQPATAQLVPDRPGCAPGRGSRSRSGSGRALLPGIGPMSSGRHAAPAQLRRERG